MNIPHEAIFEAMSALDDAAYPHVSWDDMRAILESAAPVLLSHEREETRLAHLDAMVNRAAVDRLEQELQQAKAEAWQEGRQARHDHMIGKSPSNPYLEAAWERGREDGYHHRPNPYKEAGE